MARVVAEIVTVGALGHGGDGIAVTEAGRVFVPFTLAGETVKIERRGNRGSVRSILAASGDRVKPSCRHFGACGGCTLQHMERGAGLAWKRDIVATSLALHNVDAFVDPVVATDAGNRRRAVLSAVNTTRGVILGFNRRATQEIIAIAECPVLDAAIVAKLPAIREIVAIALKPRRRARVVVLLASNGLDVAVDGGGRLDQARLAALGKFGGDPSIARLTVDDAVIFMNRRPEIAADGAVLSPASGGFVQASQPAEAALADAMLAHVGDGAAVADLFAGIGAFTVRLARRAAVMAVEGDAALVEALQQAVRQARGLKPVSVSRRDLFANPLSPGELGRFGAVVFDPPATGARAQAQAIAACGVPKVVAVSCNPATLARDARILVDGGYRLIRVLPVDQFVWSAEIEVVATFAR